MPRRFRTLRLSYLILIQATKCLDLSYDNSSSELDSITLLIVNYVSCSFLDRGKQLIMYLLGTWPESRTVNDLTGGKYVRYFIFATIEKVPIFFYFSGILDDGITRRSHYDWARFKDRGLEAITS